MQETLHTAGNTIYVHLVTPTFITGYSPSVITDEPGYSLISNNAQGLFFKTPWNFPEFSISKMLYKKILESVCSHKVSACCRSDCTCAQQINSTKQNNRKIKIRLIRPKKENSNISFLKAYKWEKGSKWNSWMNGWYMQPSSVTSWLTNHGNNKHVPCSSLFSVLWKQFLLTSVLLAGPFWIWLCFCICSMFSKCCACVVKLMKTFS